MSTAAGRRPKSGAERRHKSFYESARVAILDHLEPRLLFSGTFPIVQSIARGTPATAETSASTVTYSVAFSQNVSGVDPSDFRITTSGGASASSAVTVTPNSASTYSVTVTGVHGSGSLSLELVDDDSIRDTSSNPLGGPGVGNGSYVGPNYLVNQTFPFVTSINRAGGAGSTTSASAVDFTVTFSKPVSGVSGSNFQVVAGTGVQVAGTPSVVQVNGSTYTVHVSGISGSGSVGLNLANPAGIHDSSGNPLADPSSGVTLQPQQTIAGGIQPASLQWADMNSDGRGDLVVADTAGNTVGVMPGQPGGTLGPQSTTSVSTPANMAVLDVNGDGNLDVVTVGSDHVAALLLGNGDGTLAAASTFLAGALANMPAAGDFNGDGRPDLVFGRGAAQGQSAVSVMLNTGAGQFTPPVSLPTGMSPLSVATGDVNSDGKIDIITANAVDATAGVLLGNGDGTFKASVTYAVNAYPIFVATSDVNGDGTLDLVTANFNAGTLSVLLGNGDGTFANQRTYSSGPYPSSVQVGDLNGDGKPDLVATNAIDNTVSVLAGNGDGTFSARQTLNTGASPSPIVLADIDGDGRCDIVVGNRNSNTLSIFRTPPPGPFTGQAYQIVPPSGSVSGTAGDDHFTLSRDPDNSHIDWTLGSASGQILINDASGLTINGLGGNDTLTLDPTHGNPLPDTLHLNGVFSLVGLSGANPLAGVTLDIGRSTVYLDNSANLLPITLIRQYLANGYNQGAWTGTPTPTTGVITSSAAASSPPNTFAVGYADSASGAVAGQPANTIELRYTLLGDCNLDTTVNSPDAVALARAYILPASASWTQGDFNYDGAVNAPDATLLQKNYNTTVPPLTFTAPSVEPLSPSIPSATVSTDPFIPTGGNTDTPVHRKSRHDRRHE